VISADTKSVIERARMIYTQRLQTRLGDHEVNRFVAIEPESGDCFLGDTFDEVAKAARVKYPSRLSHTIRNGHRAALHMGGRSWIRRNSAR
jgi:hypothetical protein